MDAKPKDHPEFWTDVTTLREPAYTEADPEDLMALEDALHDAVEGMTRRISLRAQAYRAAQQEIPDGIALSGDYQLATLHALRQANRTIDTYAAQAASVAGSQGASYTKMGAAWGFSRQAARLKWPDAVPPKGEPRPLELELAGGQATITQLPDERGYVWQATAETGATEQGEQPYASQAEAAAHAGAFLQRHRYAPLAAHTDCTHPHSDDEGEPVDCDGRPL